MYIIVVMIYFAGKCDPNRYGKYDSSTKTLVVSDDIKFCHGFSFTLPVDQVVPEIGSRYNVYTEGTMTIPGIGSSTMPFKSLNIG